MNVEAPTPREGMIERALRRETLSIPRARFQAQCLNKAFAERGWPSDPHLWIRLALMSVGHDERRKRFLALLERSEGEQLREVLSWWQPCNISSSGPEGRFVLEAFRRVDYVSPTGRRFDHPTTVYRGTLGEDPRLGFCWALTAEDARRFAARDFEADPGQVSRWDGEEEICPTIWSALAPPSAILASWSFASELVVDPAGLSEVVVHEQSVQMPSPMAQPTLLEFTKGACNFLRERAVEDHDEQHAYAVAATGLDLACDVPGADRELVYLFGLLHDIARNRPPVYEHALRAASTCHELARGGALVLDKARLETLTGAIGAHDEGYTSDDPTIGCCWDADRLHLPRVGIEVNPALLSTDAACEPHRVEQARRRREEPIDWPALVAQVERKPVAAAS